MNHSNLQRKKPTKRSLLDAKTNFQELYFIYTHINIDFKADTNMIKLYKSNYIGKPIDLYIL